MPYSKCPLCSAIVHWNVRQNLEQWYAEHFPGQKPSPIVPVRCFDCWQDLAEGDRVVVRKLLLDGSEAVKPGDKGTLLAAITSKDNDSLYEFESDAGVKAYLARAEIRKMRSDEE